MIRTNVRWAIGHIQPRSLTQQARWGVSEDPREVHRQNMLLKTFKFGVGYQAQQKYLDAADCAYAAVKLAEAAQKALDNRREDAEKVRKGVSKSAKRRILSFDQFVARKIPFDVYLQDVAPLYSFPWPEKKIVEAYSFAALNEYRQYVQRATTKNNPSTIL